MTALTFPMSQFEDGMIARVKAASVAVVDDLPLLGYVIREVETYKGQLNGGPTRIAEKIRVMPAVWICFEDASYQQDTGLWLGNFSAVCIAADARNEQNARRGAGIGQVGAYQIGKDVAGLLDGQYVGVEGCTAIYCTRIDAPFNAEFEKTRCAIVLLTFQVMWDPQVISGPAGDVPILPGEPNASGINNFLTFDVSWDLPPTASVDAEDKITVNPS
jgi:phage gp37-like protein